MTVTKDDDIDLYQNKCETMVSVESNLGSQYTIGSNDFILVDEVGEKPKKNVKERLKDISSCFNTNLKSAFSYKTVSKRLPILKWFRTYSGEDAIGDLMAGITIGMTIIPQSMAYAALAGLPPQLGLYGSFLGSLMYVFLGTCKEVSMGPTAIVSLMTYNAMHGLEPIYSTLLCFLVGIIQLLIGLAGLGFLIDFISGPVNSGFTSAVAILIFMSQFKDLIGIKAAGTNLENMIISILQDISHYQLGDTTIGLICIVAILLLRKIAMYKIGPKDTKEQTPFQRFVNQTLWVIGNFRSTVVIVISSYVSYKLISATKHDVTSDDPPPIPFKVIGKISSDFPGFSLPPFRVTQANGITIGFFEMVSNIGSGIIMFPVIGLIETISICKVFADGKPIDATQELLATGLCNIGNSFFHAYPGGGSFSRCAVTSTSGVRTPMQGLYSGIFVIVSILFCTPYFYYIPKSAIAAIIMTAVIFMVEVQVVRPIYRSKKSDLIPGLATFFACLFLPLQTGVLIGIGLNLVSILYHAARPKLLIEVHKTRDGINYLMIMPDRCLVFPSVDYVRNLVTKHSLKRELPVVIDCSHVYGADFTAAKVIEILTQDFSKRGQALFFYNLKPSVVAVFEGVQPKDFITYYHKHDLDHLYKQWKQQREEIKNQSDE